MAIESNRQVTPAGAFGVGMHLVFHTAFKRPTIFEALMVSFDSVEEDPADPSEGGVIDAESAFLHNLRYRMQRKAI